MKARCALTKGEQIIEKVIDILTSSGSGDKPLFHKWRWIAASMHQSNPRISERFCADVVVDCSGFNEREGDWHETKYYAVAANASREIGKLLNRPSATTPERVDLIVWRDRGIHRGGFEVMLRVQYDDYKTTKWLPLNQLVEEIKYSR